MISPTNREFFSGSIFKNARDKAIGHTWSLRGILAAIAGRGQGQAWEATCESLGAEICSLLTVSEEMEIQSYNHKEMISDSSLDESGEVIKS